MSFMFHPYPYKDLNAVNAVAPRDTVVEGALPVARRIAALFGDCLLYTSPSPRD